MGSMLHQTHSSLCCNSTDKYFNITLFYPHSLFQSSRRNIYAEKHVKCNNVLSAVCNSVGVWKIHYAEFERGVSLAQCFIRDGDRANGIQFPGHPAPISYCPTSILTLEKQCNLASKRYSGVKLPDNHGLWIILTYFFNKKCFYVTEPKLVSATKNSWQDMVGIMLYPKNGNQTQKYKYQIGLPVPLFILNLFTRWFKYDRDYLCVNKSHSLSRSYLKHLVQFYACEQFQQPSI